MKILKLLQTELKNEYRITIEFISKFPGDKVDFKPHEKSMDITTLANHIVEIFAWPALILQTDKLDFAAGDYKPTKFETSEELLKKLEEDYKTGKTALKKATNGDLKKNWKNSLEKSDKWRFEKELESYFWRCCICRLHKI